MGDDRKNIKCSPETFTRLSSLLDDTNLNWDGFLNELADAYEAIHEGDVDDSDITLEDLARELDSLRETLPKETANELEERLR